MQLCLRKQILSVFLCQACRKSLPLQCTVVLPCLTAASAMKTLHMFYVLSASFTSFTQGVLLISTTLDSGKHFRTVSCGHTLKSHYFPVLTCFRRKIVFTVEMNEPAGLIKFSVMVKMSVRSCALPRCADFSDLRRHWPQCWGYSDWGKWGQIEAAVDWKFEKAHSDSCGKAQCHKEKMVQVFICRDM